MSLTTLLKAHGDKGPHLFWREDLGECHNPLFGCWCCVCSGFMCGCPCHSDKYGPTGHPGDGEFQDWDPGDPGR